MIATADKMDKKHFWISPFSRWEKEAILKFHENFDNDYENIIQRWGYEDEGLTLDVFFEQFNHSENVDAFFEDAAGLIYDGEFFEKTRDSWRLDRLREKMFYWDDYGVGIINYLGYCNTGNPNGFDLKDVFAWRDNFIDLFIGKECLFTCYATGLSSDLLNLNKSTIHNLDGWEDYQSKDEFHEMRYAEFLSNWMQTQGEANSVLIIRNHTKKEILMFTLRLGDDEHKEEDEHWTAHTFNKFLKDLKFKNTNNNE